MSADLAPRPLADLEEDALIRVEAEWQRRARSGKPWTTSEYLDRIDRVHAHYKIRREWLRTHPQEVAA
jgi:hypothetical protein